MTINLYDRIKIGVVEVTVRLLAVFDRRHRGTISWVVGMEEIAGMVRQLSDAIPQSHSVSIKNIAFYEHRYDTAPRAAGGPRMQAIERILLRPIRFGWLIHRSRGFIYVARLGFLGLSGLSREGEFKLIKAHGRHLCCYFTGNDIRVPRLMHELEERTGVVNSASALKEGGEIFASDAYERVKRQVATEANAWADVVFTASTDQLSYLEPPTEPFLYFHPDDDFATARAKFDDIAVPVIVHAASKPHLKGTSQVRDAIASLRDAGYEFEYVELVGVSHQVIRENLARAHIVLNQFYAFMPGVFGIESLAARCAVLMSADRELEPDLPPGANDAWMVTRLHQVEDNLRHLLDHPEEIEPLAQAGQDWARKYASASESGKRLGAILQRVENGTYEEPLPWA